MCCKASFVFNRLIIITSPIGGGKTQYLTQLHLPEPYGGVITSSNLEKTRYTIKDLHSKEDRLLLSEEELPNARIFRRFFVLEETFAWANDQISAHLSTCKAVVFDEIGPIELEGWGLRPSLLKALQTPNIDIYISVRDSLLEKVIRAFALEGRITKIIDLQKRQRHW